MFHKPLHHRLVWTPAIAWAALAAACLLLSMVATPAHASSWNPTLLVNTESFQTIDDGDSATSVELRFGDTANEKLSWSVSHSRFEFSDDVHVDDNITGSGGLAIELNIRAKGDLNINSDNDTNDAVLTFGNATLGQSLSFVNASQKFRFSTSLDVVGTISGSALTVSGLRNCNTVDTDADGNFVCGTDEGTGGGTGGGGMSLIDADARYVNTAGDTMTGSLNVRGTVSGALLKAGNMFASGAVVYSSGNTLMQSAQGSSGQLLLSQGAGAPKWATPIGGMVWLLDGNLTTGATQGAKVVMPMSVTLSSVTMTIKGTPTGAALIANIRKDGTSIFATRPQVDSGSFLGGSSAVFSDYILPEGAIVTLDIDQVGSTFAGSGMTLILKGFRNY